MADASGVVLSICIPTFNRANHLANCLNSIAIATRGKRLDFEVCVSDNGSTDGTEAVVASAPASLPLRYRRNSENLGLPRNFLAAVEMARGRFAWLIGDDDLLLPGAVETLLSLIAGHPRAAFFFVNSFHLDTDRVFAFPQPFDTANLPDDMIRFSSWPQSGERPFFELIDPRVAFDFLGGMYLSVFERSRWLAHASALDPKALADRQTFSHFDNTFPHLKIFARAFADATAYLHAEPLSVCLTGAREWAPLHLFVRTVRLFEALEEYRRNGLPLLRYLWCKNYSLRTFLPDLAWMQLNRDASGLGYASIPRLLLGNMLYPNLYLSVLYYAWRKLREGRRRRQRRDGGIAGQKRLGGLHA